MRWTQALIPTLNEDPQDAEVISHKLMVRGGLIRKLFSGAYSYLPLGVRVLANIKAIIREELNAAGAQEVLLPAIHPTDLWKKTGRYDLIGEVLVLIEAPEPVARGLGLHGYSCASAASGSASCIPRWTVASVWTRWPARPRLWR